MSSSELGTTRAGGINEFRVSEDERALIWVNDAGERNRRPADEHHIYLWRRLVNMTREAEAAFEQIAQFIAAEEAKKQ